MNLAPHRPLSVAVSAAIVGLCLSSIAQAPPSLSRTPVLVELFTSEGCSSCPPADALLIHLLRDQPIPTANVIVLSEHVDYWDSLGWRDRFSSHQLTERQSAYAQRFRTDGPYTPQMVVDGADQFVGSDSSRALHSIALAARTPKLALTLSPIAVHNGNAEGQVFAAPASAAVPKADLYAALVEVTASTRVQRGENGGRTLQHVSVVRALQRIGSLDALAHGATPFSLAVLPNTAAPLQIIVFAQQQGQGAILCVAASPTIPAQALAQTRDQAQR
ncbi:MAG: DUF1223 domain-containing protein [Acidobacteriaceae bacterium]